MKYRKKTISDSSSISKDCAKTLADRYVQETERAVPVQRRFLPQDSTEVPGYDFGVVYQPLWGVSGDFYELRRHGSDRLVVAVGDISGKGQSAALLMAYMLASLRFLSDSAPTPGHVLSDLNSSLLSHSPGNRFATLFYGFLEVSSGKLQYSQAAHLPPLVYRSSYGEVESLGTHGDLLGVWQHPQFETRSTTLEPGDVFVLYTDGVTEVRNTRDDELTQDELARVLVENSHRSAEALAGAIVERAKEFSKDHQLKDDTTVFVIKRTPGLSPNHQVALLDDSPEIYSRLPIPREPSEPRDGILCASN